MLTNLGKALPKLDTRSLRSAGVADRVGENSDSGVCSTTRQKP